MSVIKGRVCNKETLTKASTFYELIASFDFFATLLLPRSILYLTLPATELLQAKKNDMADASHLFGFLKSVILPERNTVDEFHNNCYIIILEIANKVSINETKPRVATFQKNRSNLPSKSVTDYF